MSGLSDIRHKIRHKISCGADVLRRLQNLQSCIFCLASPAAGGTCSACYAELPFIERGCLLCAIPLEPTAGAWQELCVSCQKKSPPLDHAFSVLHYRVPLRRVLHGLKFQRQVQYVRPLANIWLAGLRLANETNRLADFKADLLLPVPLHPIKLQQRGFNPGYALAKPIARSLKIPLSATGCRRIRNTRPQHNLSPTERRQNLKDAFEVRTDEIKGKNIVILDDVITSAATIYELANTLRRNGAKQVGAWSLLRA